MSDKRKKRKFAAKRERRRLKRLTEDGPVISGVRAPRGAVEADVSQQMPNNSYSPPPLFYVDKEFACVDCGSEEVWTAQQQKWYYEVAKGSLYATAVRCRRCRRRRAQQKETCGDPNPIKHQGTLMKRLRASLEPSLTTAGFTLVSKGKEKHSRHAWFEYARPDMTFRCLLEPRDIRLIAEAMDDQAEYCVVANVQLDNPRSQQALLDRIEVFVSAIEKWLKKLP